MGEKNIGKDFLDLLTDAKKNPEKYQAIKECKNLSEVYSFIKKIHPEYTFTEEELGKLILGLTKIPDNELTISGGTNEKATKEDIAAISQHLGTLGYITKMGSEAINLFSDMLFSENEMSPAEMQQKVMAMIQNTKSGENFQSDDMYPIKNNLEPLKDVHELDRKQIANLVNIGSGSLKKLSQPKSKDLLQGRFSNYAGQYTPGE